MADLAEAMVEYFEGLELTAYKDTRGLWTVGYGHLLDQSKDWTGYTITQDKADALMNADMGSARAYAAIFPHFTDMNDVRQAVCVSMCFQLGSKPLHWPDFDAALDAQDYIKAAAAGRDSDWWRWQTHNRAELEMSMLETGNWELPVSS